MIKGTRRSPDERRRRSKALPVVVAVALLTALGLAYLHLSGLGQDRAEAPPAPETEEIAPVPSDSTESQPAPEDGEGAAPPPPEKTVVLPALEESDPLVREMAGEASARPELRAWLSVRDLVRRFVAGVANVADGDSPREQLLFLAPKERFRVVPHNGGLVADPRSHARYDIVAEVFTSLDVPALVRAYQLLEPLLQEAFSELGLPDGRFEETLDRAIRELLQAPRIGGAVELRKVGSFYEYIDEELEGCSPAQRHLLRMGPRNALRVQAKLREIRIGLGLADDEG